MSSKSIKNVESKLKLSNELNGTMPAGRFIKIESGRLPGYS